MTQEDAKTILTEVCSQFRGTLKEHQLVQEALRRLMEQPAVEGTNEAEG